MTISGSELYEYARSLCEAAGDDNEYLEVFWSTVSKNPKLLKEFAYYAMTNDFLMEYRIEGMTVADILVWQVDRFKAAIDEGKFELKYNAPHMILAAFLTMDDVSKNPGKYMSRFNSETGCDYPGKTYLRDLGV